MSSRRGCEHLTRVCNCHENTKRWTLNISHRVRAAAPIFGAAKAAAIPAALAFSSNSHTSAQIVLNEAKTQGSAMSRKLTNTFKDGKFSIAGASISFRHSCPKQKGWTFADQGHSECHLQLPSRYKDCIFATRNICCTIFLCFAPPPPPKRKKNLVDDENTLDTLGCLGSSSTFMAFWLAQPRPLVMEPSSGFYWDPVLVLDFKGGTSLRSWGFEDFKPFKMV